MRNVGRFSPPVSPILETVGVDLDPILLEDSDGEEDEPDEALGERCERIRAADEGECIRRLVDPQLPSQAEVDSHFLQGHIPYRNWCPVCVRSRGRERDHSQCKRERTIPEYCFDYYFPGDDLGYKWVVLVGKERLTGTFMATALPAKGSRGKFGVDKCLEFISENGDSARDIILKGDQEISLGWL